MPYDLAIPLLGFYQEEIIIRKYTCAPMFTAALSTIIAKTWKTTCPLIDEWITMWHIYTKKYYLAIKKNEIMLFAATWINLEMIILITVSQIEKDKCNVT